MLENRELYLCRADLLQEKFEGSYSRQQILDTNNWLKDIDATNVIDQGRVQRIRDKERTYISCWCVGECDYDLMWKAYIGEKRGVVIKSTVRKLHRICDDNNPYWPLDISLVKYFDHAGGEFVSEFGTPDIFLKKDKHFMLDNELRIIHWPNFIGSTPKYVGLPVKQLGDFIEKVMLQPRANTHFLKDVQALLERAELNNIPVFYSRDDREFMG